jgi:hypothetical protein
MKPLHWQLSVSMVCPAGHEFTGDNEGLRVSFVIDAPEGVLATPTIVYLPVACPKCAVKPKLRLVRRA